MKKKESVIRLVWISSLATLILAISSTARAGMEEGVAAYTNRDYSAALQEFMPLAEAGKSLAQVYVGMMYQKGDGVVEDHRLAAAWYMKAALQGEPLAQYALGRLYYLGDGIEKDYASAATQLRFASAAGIPQAQNYLAKLFSENRGVPFNLVAAYALYNMAAAAGAENAADNREKVAAYMSSEDIAKAQALTKELGKPGMFLKALDAVVEH